MRLIIIRKENNSHSQINKGKEKDIMKKITILGIILTFFTNLSFAAEVNVFSARHYDSDIQLYKKFTEKTGIKVNVVSGKDKALQKRITEEGADSKADIYITADAGRLGAFDAKGMFQNSMTSAIKAAVPKNFRSTNWTGIAKRARIMYYAPERVNANELNGMTYESLADPKWKGRVVIRKSNNIYNQSLVASLVKNNGKKATCEWSKGVVANMARDSKGNDRAQILAVAAGEADLAVANTYYLALMLSGKKGAEQQAAAKKVLPFFPNQGDRGTHMNISGGGVLKNAPNPENAKKLLEFLLTKEAQKHIVNNTFEYPMIDGVEPHDLVKQMGIGFKQDLNTKVVNYGKNQAIALECMLAAKWK
jgi:iron(III) transport system substrate-binding protein